MKFPLIQQMMALDNVFFKQTTYLLLEKALKLLYYDSKNMSRKENHRHKLETCVSCVPTFLLWREVVHSNSMIVAFSTFSWNFPALCLHRNIKLQKQTRRSNFYFCNKTFLTKRYRKKIFQRFWIEKYLSYVCFLSQDMKQQFYKR